MSQVFRIGTNVRTISVPPYLKTADPMPMLRPANLVEVGHIGTIVDRRPGGYWVVKFDRGSFLLEESYIEAIEN